MRGDVKSGIIKAIPGCIGFSYTLKCSPESFIMRSDYARFVV